MSYIDDLKNAAARANVASDRADGASKIIYDVAHGPDDEIVETENGPVLTLAHAISRIQYLGGLDIAGLGDVNKPLTGSELFVVVQDGADVKLTLQDIQDSITAGVESVNGLEGAVVLTTDEVLEGDLNKYFKAADKTKLDGIEDGAQVNDVQSVNSKIGVIVLDAADVGAIDITEKGTAEGVATLDVDGKIPESQLPSTVTGAVQMVNGHTGNVILTTDDVSEGATNKYFTSTYKDKLDGIESGAEKNTVLSVNGQVGEVTIEATDFGAIPVTEKGVVGGVATLGEDGKVPENQLPEIEAGIEEAPIDGKLYGRKQEAWVEIDQASVANVSTVISYPTDGEENVNLDLTITTEPFESPYAENHVSTDWVVLASDGVTVVWESLEDTVNLTSVTLPADTLDAETSYIVRARFHGSILGAFPWSEDVQFTTEVEVVVLDPSNAGEPYGGGYYAGANIIVDGSEYALVVAPLTQGGEATLDWEWATDSDVPEATSTNDGRSNTSAIVAAGGSSSEYAAGFCSNLTINGYSDWHMPSKDELEICYRYLKSSTNSNDTASGENLNSNPVGAMYTSSDPAQTSITIFQPYESEAFFSGYYWTSTQSSGSNAIYQLFSRGEQASNSKSLGYRVRAVRWVAI